MDRDRIVLSLDHRIGHGAFADVFAARSETVVKLFYRREALSTRPADDPHDYEVITRAMWDAERAAYELLTGRPDLSRYTCPYYGSPMIDDIVSADGTSVGARYVLDCAIRLHRVPGTDRKVGDVADPLFCEIDAALDELAESGIGNPYDASFFAPGLSGAFTIIDFSKWDAQGELSHALQQTGRVSDQARSRWGRPIERSGVTGNGSGKR